MKQSRQKKILEIIEDYPVETQEELAERLKQSGIDTTQATISRDIKELRLVKILEGGRYRYALKEQDADSDFSSRLNAIFRESVTSFDHAGNIVIIKTMPGLASAACSALDTMRLSGVVGTLAGDDTGMILLRDDGLANAFCAEIEKMLG